MEYKLNIYNSDNEVEKTYVANDFILKVGTAEDILKLVKVEKLSGSLEDTATILEIIKIVSNAFDSFNPMMKSVFKGLTDDEYQRASVVEVGMVVVNIIQYTFVQLTVAASGKN